MYYIIFERIFSYLTCGSCFIIFQKKSWSVTKTKFLRVHQPCLYSKNYILIRRCCIRLRRFLFDPAFRMYRLPSSRVLEKFILQFHHLMILSKRPKQFFSLPAIKVLLSDPVPERAFIPVAGIKFCISALFAPWIARIAFCNPIFIHRYFSIL